MVHEANRPKVCISLTQWSALFHTSHVFLVFVHCRFFRNGLVEKERIR